MNRVLINEKKYFGIAKPFLKLFRKFGFERDGKKFVLENYIIKLSNDEIVFQKIKDEPTYQNGVFLSSVIQMSSYDISFYYNENLDNNIFIDAILKSLEDDFNTELKWIVRKNKIKKIII